MKKWIALVLACLMGMATAALAAEWAEGCGPARPYAALPELDLDQTMGYVVLSPRAKQPASGFCGALQIWLPREDVALGAGSLTLYGDGGARFDIDFSDESAVSLRPMREEELDTLQWGGGACIEIRLPVSLVIGEHYRVFMEEGCFRLADGKVQSLAIDLPEAWEPALIGDYGVNALHYISASKVSAAEREARAAAKAAAKAAEAAQTPEEAERILAEAGQPVDPESPEFFTTDPRNGDTIAFDLVLGGDAGFAVLYSDNDSVQFAEPEYAESGRVTGKVTGDVLDWSIVFLNANGDVLEILKMTE